MSTLRATHDGRPFGSNALPMDAGHETKILGNPVTIQMPHRSLGPAQGSLGGVESDQWFDEVNRQVQSQVDGLGGT